MIRQGTKLLVVPPEAKYIEAGTELSPEVVQVVECKGNGLYEVQDADGVRWTVGREEIIRCA